MDIDASSFIQSIDASTLMGVVRKALHRDTFQIVDWRVSQLGGGAGNPVSVGLYRFEGTGQDQSETIAWSVVLKIIQSPDNVGQSNMGEGDDQTHWNYWKRELLVYQSGFLKTLPEGITAPRCYAVTELPGNVAWLWLEDIVDSYEGAWSLDRYALTARHLGQLNGLYPVARPLPDAPWLSNHLIRQWMAGNFWQTIPWEHPRVLQRYPRPEVNAFRQMLLENERFFAKLERLPLTVCHGDTYPTNFKARAWQGDQPQTVALDWALIGIAPLGDDLGQFVFGVQTNLKEVKREDVDRALFESYIAGLRDSGCHVDPQWIRFGYTASAALRVGLFQLYLLNEELKQAEIGVEQAFERPASTACFEVAMAAEAFELLKIAG
jgi:hypothetical protein